MPSLVRSAVPVLVSSSAINRPCPRLQPLPLRLASTDQSVEVTLRVLRLGHVEIKVVNCQIMEPNRAVDAIRRDGSLATGRIPKGGVVVVRINRASVPVATTAGADKCCRPVGGISG